MSDDLNPWTAEPGALPSDRNFDEPEGCPYCEGYEGNHGGDCERPVESNDSVIKPEPFTEEELADDNPPF